MAGIRGGPSMWQGAQGFSSFPLRPLLASRLNSLAHHQRGEERQTLIHTHTASGGRFPSSDFLRPLTSRREGGKSQVERRRRKTSRAIQPPEPKSDLTGKKSSPPRLPPACLLWPMPWAGRGWSCLSAMSQLRLGLGSAVSGRKPSHVREV